MKVPILRTSTSKPRSLSNNAFTLIELLVVIANLAAMLMPALAKGSSNQPVRHNHKT
jgi:prepilin-type N-terminal cleavage/methylation domain-containing protein